MEQKGRDIRTYIIYPPVFAVHVFYWCIVSNSERLCVSCWQPGQAWDVKGRKALCCCPVLQRVAPNLWKWPKCASFEVMKAGIE